MLTIFARNKLRVPHAVMELTPDSNATTAQQGVVDGCTVALAYLHAATQLAAHIEPLCQQLAFHDLEVLVHINDFIAWSWLCLLLDRLLLLNRLLERLLHLPV